MNATDMLICKAKTVEGEQVEGWIYPTRSRGYKEWMLRIDTGHHIEQADIDPSTIRRFTGKLDKNGKRIFEGDNVKFKEMCGVTEGRVVWDNQNMCWEVSNDWFLHQLGRLENLELIKEKP